MKPQLIAIDMDGTLLNSKKEVSPRNLAALNQALEEGIFIVFSTGRCIAELKQFFPLFPKMRYVLAESGACIYDIKEKKALYRHPLDVSVTKTILDDVVKRDIMPQVLAQDAAIMAQHDIDHLEHFQMGQYRKHFTDTGRLVENVYEATKECGWEAEKICLYHTSPQDRAVSQERFSSLPVTMVFAEKTSLEISANGVDKGVGLELLCNELSIPLEATVAIGDSYNDLAVLQKAGISVAMGNSAPEVKALCKMQVADCDHDGVAEAIEMLK